MIRKTQSLDVVTSLSKVNVCEWHKHIKHFFTTRCDTHYKCAFVGGGRWQQWALFTLIFYACTINYFDRSMKSFFSAFYFLAFDMANARAMQATLVPFYESPHFFEHSFDLFPAALQRLLPCQPTRQPANVSSLWEIASDVDGAETIKKWKLLRCSQVARFYYSGRINCWYMWHAADFRTLFDFCIKFYHQPGRGWSTP